MTIAHQVRSEGVQAIIVMSDGSDDDKEAVKKAAESAKALDRFSRRRSWFVMELQRQAANRYQMALDEDYYDGDQWTQAEAAEVLGEGRATILFRVIFPNITSAILSGAFLTFAIVIGEFTMASLLDRPAFGPYLQLIGANRAYEPSALAVIAFIVTWASMGLIQVFGRNSAARTQK